MIEPIFKKKDITKYDNYRGISLLCHCEKIFAPVLLQIIKARMEEILSEAQAGLEVGAAPSISRTHFGASQRNI